MLKRILFLFVLAFIAGSSLMAQITTSAIGGSVKGTADEALTGASIVATHLPSGTKYSTITRTGGNFSIQNMRVGGPYIIEITFVGYKPEKIEDVYLQLAETFQFSPTLVKTDATLENVVVTGARKGAIMNANRTGPVTNAGRREIAALPSINRSINDISRITPQAQGGGGVAGGNYRQNNVTIDGSDFNNTFGIGGNLPAQGSPISLDAIEEISVNLTPFDVRQSGFIGSALNAITRSGTNELQGSIYTFWRNEKMQGDRVGKVNIVPQNLQYNQYGGRVGGPIIKNKLFYFVNFETEKRVSPGQTKVASNTASDYGTSSNIAKPTKAELDAISAYLLSKYGYETGPYQGYDLEGEKQKLLVRFDWNISPKHKMNIRYSQTESSDPSLMSSSTSSSGVSSSYARNGITALHFKNSNYYQDYNFYSIAAELNSTFSSRIANTLRFSYNNQNDPRSSDSEVFPFVDIMSGSDAFTSFGYEPFTYGNLRDVKIYSVTDNLAMTAGKHNFLLGLQADFTKTINGFQPLGASYYRFASWTDFVNEAKPTDFAFTYSLKPDKSQAFPSFKFAQYSAFFQDDYTVNKKLKLTFGLRADRSAYPGVEEVKDNPLVSGLTFADGKKYNTGNLPKERILFSPRFGFNWDLYGDRSLQIRGGTGIFTGRVPTVWIVGQAGNSGMLQITQSYNGTANLPANVTKFNKNIGAYWPVTAPTPGSTMPSTVTVFDENFKMPQTWKTTLAIDVKLPWGIIGTLEGIYNRDYRVIYSKNVNLTAPAPLNVAGYPDNRMIYPSATTAKYINKLASGGPGILVPSASGTTAFSMIVSGNEKRGHSGFLTMKFEKPFRKGFSAMIAYTKSLSNRLYDGIGDQPFNTWSLIHSVNGPNTSGLSYGDDNIPDRVVASISYRKEYLKHLATQVTLFWEGGISGRFSYTYGNHSNSATGDINRDGTTADLMYIPKDPSEIDFVDQTINGVLYTAAQQKQIFFDFIEQDKYLRAHKGQYAERNGGQYPWRNQFDLRIVQDLFTKIGKSKNTLQFSVDIFNFGNLLNPKWGEYKLINSTVTGQMTPLLLTNASSLVAGGTVRPTFRMAVDRNQILTKTFRDNQSTTSTYYMQLGLRYLFN